MAGTFMVTMHVRVQKEATHKPSFPNRLKYCDGFSLSLSEG